VFQSNIAGTGGSPHNDAIRGGASVGAGELKPTLPQELHWKQRGRRRRRKEKGVRRKERKRNESPDVMGLASPLFVSSQNYLFPSPILLRKIFLCSG